MIYPMLLHIRSMLAARRRLTTFVFGAMLILQVGIPLAQLWAPRPARWGWQMYATLPSTPTFSVVLANGSVQPVEPSVHLTYVRMDINLQAVLPRHLCQTVADAVTVQIHHSQTAQWQEYLCR